MDGGTVVHPRRVVKEVVAAERDGEVTCSLVGLANPLEALEVDAGRGGGRGREGEEGGDEHD